MRILRKAAPLFTIALFLPLFLIGAIFYGWPRRLFFYAGEVIASAADDLDGVEHA
jgi:hypothetical protein